MASANFLLFPSLPPEIREHIWQAALGFKTPRAFVFHVDVRWTDGPMAPMQLLPGRSRTGDSYLTGTTWERRWPNLMAATQALRALLATCHESRAAALQHSPDKLPFGTIKLADVRRDGDPDTSDRDADMLLYSVRGQSPGEKARIKARIKARPREPTRYWLPFCAERDVVVVGVGSPRAERLIAEGVHHLGTPRPPLLLESVRNLAVFAGDCLRGRYGVEDWLWADATERPWNPPAPPCSCGHLDCPSCSKDALLPFLATCCPKLKTLSFAVLDRSSQPLGVHVCTNHEPYNFELVPLCACPSGKEHSWPMVKLMNQGEEWCVWYPEGQRDCPFQPLQSLVDIRARWHPNWPYYESLQLVQVRVLRCIEVEKGKDTLVSGWRVPDALYDLDALNDLDDLHVSDD